MNIIFEICCHGAVTVYVCLVFSHFDAFCTYNANICQLVTTVTENRKEKRRNLGKNTYKYKKHIKLFAHNYTSYNGRDGWVCFQNCLKIFWSVLSVWCCDSNLKECIWRQQINDVNSRSRG